MIRVLLADDQALILAGLAMLLIGEPDIELVGEARDGTEAVAQASRLLPDVVVMDIRMPGMDGVEATRRIVQSRAPGSASPSVLVLTTFNLDAALYAALQAGASGFLLKDAAPLSFLQAVRAVAAGRGYLDPEVTRSVIDQFAARPLGAARQDPRAAELTVREREVLGLMARGLSNAEIAHQLYVGEGTVKTHVSHILAKLGLRDRVQAVVFAYESGVAPS